MLHDEIYVGDIANLFPFVTDITLYFTGINRTLEFPNDDIPEVFLYCPISSIDDPNMYDDGKPICLNLNSECFENLEELLEHYKDYEI